jgi:glycine/D-amino acid oxidase-like deaminating enzyme
LTTLAIIGAGIAGKSLVYQLAKERKKYSKILLFDSPAFAFPCSMHSTAIVAPRGVSLGHSPLGDLLHAGWVFFQQHVKSERPAGVYAIEQYTGSLSKLEDFKRRYPAGSERKTIAGLQLQSEHYFAQEEAFMIDPLTYLSWLEAEAQKVLPLERHEDFVTTVETGEKNLIKTQKRLSFVADEVVFTTGSYTRFHKKIKNAKPVQGSYLEFQEVDWGNESFSITFEGDNLIYHGHSKTLLVGSTSDDFWHELSPQTKLQDIWRRLQATFKVALPAIESGVVRVGLREKASKREPYIHIEGNCSFMGGFYKNGFSLAPMLAKNLTSHLLDGPA